MVTAFIIMLLWLMLLYVSRKRLKIVANYCHGVSLNFISSVCVLFGMFNSDAFGCFCFQNRHAKNKPLLYLGPPKDARCFLRGDVKKKSKRLGKTKEMKTHIVE